METDRMTAPPADKQLQTHEDTENAAAAEQDDDDEDNDTGRAMHGLLDGMDTKRLRALLKQLAEQQPGLITPELLASAAKTKGGSSIKARQMGGDVGWQPQRKQRSEPPQYTAKLVVTSHHDGGGGGGGNSKGNDRGDTAWNPSTAAELNMPQPRASFLQKRPPRNVAQRPRIEALQKAAVVLSDVSPTTRVSQL